MQLDMLISKRQCCACWCCFTMLRSIAEPSNFIRDWGWVFEGLGIFILFSLIFVACFCCEHCHCHGLVSIIRDLKSNWVRFFTKVDFWHTKRVVHALVSDASWVDHLNVLHTMIESMQMFWVLAATCQRLNMTCFDSWCSWHLLMVWLFSLLERPDHGPTAQLARNYGGAVVLLVTVDLEVWVLQRHNCCTCTHLPTAMRLHLNF